MRGIRLVILYALIGAISGGCGATSPRLGDASPLSLGATAIHLGGGFPKGFLWGVASAGYQSEGGDVHNNWHSWELAGKLHHPIGKAVDFWNRYADDMDLAKGLGLNAFRMSVEWSRIEPAAGKYDLVALEHYRQMIDAAKKRGLEPIVTLSHFVYPAWLDSGGGPAGWERPEAPVHFGRFVRLVASALRGKVRTWITHNEPETLTVGGFLAGQIPPGRMGYGSYSRAVKGIVAAHRAAYQALHELDPANRVSANVFYHYVKGPTTYDPAKLWGNEVLLGGIATKGHASPKDAYLDWPGHAMTGFPGPYLDDFGADFLDYIAVDYYWGMSPGALLRVRKSYTWSVTPALLVDACVDLWKRYHKPILIAENGLSTNDLAKRTDGWTREAFIVHHLYYLLAAVKKGVSVMGYMYWSLTDNYEWGDWAPRFGLYSVDGLRDASLRRVPTAAVATYKQIVQANALPQKMIWSYMGFGSPN